MCPQESSAFTSTSATRSRAWCIPPIPEKSSSTLSSLSMSEDVIRLEDMSANPKQVQVFRVKTFDHAHQTIWFNFKCPKYASFIHNSLEIKKRSRLQTARNNWYGVLSKSRLITLHAKLRRLQSTWQLSPRHRPLLASCRSSTSWRLGSLLLP